ncbi:MAG: PD-(D/E)XK nuclease family protein [Anaerolineaceae bacterium]|nr:PD-(D/E)XK nuclease family protein [Anaerolineaceae bacterium]
MLLKPDFHFSQYNLQDYLDCPRRFELRHLRRLEWPAVQSEPVIEQEERMERGSRFHRMVQQAVSGVPAERISAQIDDPRLARWWNHFLDSDPIHQHPGINRVEYTLSAPFMNFRVLAKYDLLQIEPSSSAVIYDWKTAQHRPNSQHLRGKMQSHLYPLLLVLAGERLNQGQYWPPDQVRMHYWFADFPDQPEVIHYGADLYQKGCDLLRHTIECIVEADQKTDFPLTDDERRCKYCQYRSFCERGISAGSASEATELDEDWFAETDSFEINFEQIGEIEF